jgi:hypothetical protein
VKVLNNHATQLEQLRNVNKNIIKKLKNSIKNYQNNIKKYQGYLANKASINAAEVIALINEVAEQNEKVVTKLVSNPVFEPEPENEANRLAREKKDLLKRVNSLNKTVFEDQNKANFRAGVESGEIKTENDLIKVSEKRRQEKLDATIQANQKAAKLATDELAAKKQAEEQADKEAKRLEQERKNKLKGEYNSEVNKITSNNNARRGLKEKEVFNTFYNRIPPVNVQKFIRGELSRLGYFSNQEKALSLITSLNGLKKFLNENPNYSNDAAIVKKFTNIAKLITSAPRYNKTPNQRKNLDQLSSKLSAKTKNNVQKALEYFLSKK